jgi:hypothetical protein
VNPGRPRNRFSFLLACALCAGSAFAATKVPPPPPPPPPGLSVGTIDFTLAVEFPDGRKLSTRVTRGFEPQRVVYRFVSTSKRST